MKKQAIAIALMSAVITLTGCSINIDDDTMSQAANMAVSMLDEADIKVNGQDVDVSLDSNGNINISTAQAETAAAADIRKIIGTWYEADVLDSRTLTIKEDGTFELAYRGGGAQYGTVKAETAQNPDGSAVIWYNLYESDGAFLTGFQDSGSVMNDLYSGQDGAMHFVRAAENQTAASDTDIAPLIGEWYYEQQDPQNGALYDDAGFVSVAADCTYTYQPKDGSALKRGTIKVDYDEYPDGSKVPFWAFYDNDGQFFIGIYCTQDSLDTFYVGNGGSERLVRRYGDENPFEEYVGQWQCDRCSITISTQGTGYGVEIHWADSASEDNVWNYSCVCSDDGTFMECLGGGTLTHIVTAEDGTETRTVIYDDGTAVFNIKGGTLFWQDVKEDKGHQMGFKKIG